VVDKASQSYKNKTKQALAECKQKVMDVWKYSQSAAAGTTGVYEETVDKTMKAREKAEIDALVAYRQEVDKAVDRVSQAYRDRVTQALAECRQRVLDAWKNSQETSAQMTGVFEEDKNINHEKHLTGRRPEYHQSTSQNKFQRLKNGFLSFCRTLKREFVEKHAE
jgi:hypothetical protein